MNNPIEYYKQAQLAFAAYAKLNNGISVEELTQTNIGMSLTQGDCTYSSSTVIQHSRAFAHMPLKLPPRKIRSQSATYAPIL